MAMASGSGAEPRLILTPALRNAGNSEITSFAGVSPRSDSDDRDGPHIVNHGKDNPERFRSSRIDDQEKL
jgi:hypothetical protein